MRPPDRRVGLRSWQRAFNQFRKIYNDERPHEALALETPGSLYTRARRRMPRRMPPLVYPEGYQRRRVNQHGQIRWRRHRFFLSETPRRETVELNLREDGRWDVFFGLVPLAILDER